MENPYLLKTEEQLREDFRQENEAKKLKIKLYREQVYQKASCSDKIKMIIRSWFEKDD